MNPFDMEAGKEDILNILFQSDVKLTPQAFIKEIKSKVLVSSFEAKKILQQLIDEQELSYHYLYGATYIEKSFLKPVRMTKHFILKPPGYKARSNRNDIEIMIEQGMSFGSGQHPTTQLSLAAIDFCLFEKQFVNAKKRLVCADIGTGSGVLAMAMCLSGFASCDAYEIDPVSINEAKRNIKLNCLKEQIKVIDGSMKERKNIFSIITANLRFPTLKSLSETIYVSLRKKGIAILSGVREWEKDQLATFYSEKGFELIWQKDAKKWSAFVLLKKV